EGELPLYAQNAVEGLLENIRPVPFGAPLQIGRTGVTATWFPAGHILGAASIGIEAVEQGRTMRVLFSGDIAVGDQLTVPGMLAPKNFRPDVLVIESTYGDRLHSPRELEEQRLLEMVAGVIGNQGKLLIPAFAIGRAQEVMLMLLKQFRAKRLQSFPVWIDGMVRTICGVYSRFPAHQTAYARRLIEKHGNPFFNVVDEIRPVASPAEREQILAGPPCVIIASSGMLTGGASAFYAPHIVANERNGIAITGYQDEESPGRQLLSLADRETREVSVGGKTLEVKAGVAKYSLSAHADCNEIAGLIEAINPREVVLVHGEGTARPALADLLRRQGSRRRYIHQPRTGDTMTFGGVHRAHSLPAEKQIAGVGNGERLDVAGLARLAVEMREAGEEGRLFTEMDLLNRWYGAHGWEEEQYGELIRLLDDNEDFRRPKSRAHLYRLLRPEAKEPEETIIIAEPNEMLARLERAFGPEAGLYKRGYDLATHTLRLSFEFPLIAKEKHSGALDELVAGTGWTYSFNETPHQARLAEVALECLPAGVQAARAPAIRHAQQEVEIKTDVWMEEGIAQAAAMAFQQRTGWRLLLQTPARPHPVTAPQVEAPVAIPATPAVNDNAPQLVETPLPPVEQGPSEFLPDVARPPAQFEQALRMIEDAFDFAPPEWRPSRLKLKNDEKGDYIRLAFLTPQIGYRQKRTLEVLARDTGYRLRIWHEPNMITLISIARKMIPAAWKLTREPGVHRDSCVVRARCAAAPAPGDPERGEIIDAFMEQTGWRLEIMG
ncbi:MAG: MBL fold metallo-hydrolase, partial [Blastocatellia bacterium]